MNAHPPSPGHLADAENWAHYLEPDERLLGTWRPDDTFRLYGSGKAILMGSAVFVAVMLLAFLLFGLGSGTGTLASALGMLALGAALALGPAWLDRHNRRARRYAVSDRRALEFQDIRNGRLRSVAFGTNTWALKLYNENMESHELSFVNLDAKGRATASVLFERLTEAQREAILRTLGRAGISPAICRGVRNVTAMGKRKNLLLGERRQ